VGLFWNSAAENANIRLAKQAAAGNGPSAARSQLAQGLSQAQNYMSAQAAGVRQNPLAAQRQAQQQGAQMASQANMQSAQLRGQEQLIGQQQLATIAQNDAAAQQALVGGLTSMASTGLAGGLAGMGGKPEDGATSDVNAKRDIQPAGDRTDALLQSIQPEQYNYRDPARHGQGNRLGVMAQDLARADPNLVDRQPDGNLAINQPAALSASLAANARLAQRLDALESRTGAAPPTRPRGTTPRDAVDATRSMPTSARTARVPTEVTPEEAAVGAAPLTFNSPAVTTAPPAPAPAAPPPAPNAELMAASMRASRGMPARTAPGMSAPEMAYNEQRSRGGVPAGTAETQARAQQALSGSAASNAAYERAMALIARSDAEAAAFDARRRAR
jgi:hypothetical protein